MSSSQISRYLTTFDAAIYSIIYTLAAGLPRPPHLHCEKFGKKNLEYFRDDEVGKIFVDISYIAIGEKVRDDKTDGDNLKAFAVEKLFSKEISNAAENNPEAQNILSSGFDELNRMQEKEIDAMSLFDFYADVSVNMFASMFKKRDIGERYLDLIRAILKWTFFIDMVCDYEDDLKKGTFNSFKDHECRTFSDYFDKHFIEVFDINAAINNQVIHALNAIRDDSAEWRILYSIITYSLNNVMQDKIAGKDPRFKIVKETVKNWKEHFKKLPEKESSN